MSLLFKNARVLTFDAADTEIDRTDVLVEGAIITRIGTDIPAPEGARIIESEGHLLMPGLVNGHLHSPGNLMKGSLDDSLLELFMLYEVPPLADLTDSPRLHYLRTLLGAVEMLKLGVTAVHDDAFFIPVPTPETIDAVMGAYRDAGMRATVTLDQPNVPEDEKYPFLAEILPPDLLAELRAVRRMSDSELLDHYRDFVARWHGAEGGRLRCAASVSAPQRVTPTYLVALTEFARAHDLAFDVHVLETRLQRVLGDVKYGKSLIRYLHDLGCLDEGKQVIHSIWVDDEDIALMAASGCVVAHNPLCNLKLGSGVMPFRRLRDAGIPICLGSDEASGDDTANMWLVAKQAGLVHKLTDTDERRWPKAPEILDCLIRGGARSLRQEDRIGRVAPGYEADLILLDLDTLAFTPLNDLRRQLVFCETGTSVVMTVVQGRVVAEHGRVLTVDERALRAEIRSIMPEYNAALARARHHADRLEPYYRAMYERTLTHPVPMQRRIPS
ncbi:MAG: amidohydrolase family protein [Geminicoccaceae bacterium]